MATRGPQRGLESVLPQVFGCSHELSQNKFFNLSTPSLRKGRDGEKKNGGGMENNDENSGH